MLGKKYFQLINNIALVAVLFSSLAPTISQAFPFDGAPKPFIVEICSADGTKRIEASIIGGKTENQAQIPSQRDARLHAGHCAICCAGQTDSNLVALPIESSLFLTDAIVHQVVTFYTPPTTTHFFHSANLAQAPPQSVRI